MSDSNEKFFDHRLNSFVNGIPSNIIAGILNIELLHERIVINLFQLVSVVHDCEMCFIHIEGTRIEGKVIIGGTNPENFVKVNLEWIQRFQHDNETEVNFLFTEGAWLADIFLGKTWTTFEQSSKKTSFNDTSSFLKNLPENDVQILGDDHIHTTCEIWWFDNPVIVEMLFFSVQIVSDESLHLSIEII